MSRRLRTLAVFSVLWMVVVFLMALDVASDFYGLGSFSYSLLVMRFCFWGLLPNILIWGIVWICNGPKVNRKEDKTEGVEHAVRTSKEL
jgi:hypothetical protein